MKKIVCILLTLTMIMSFGAVAFAADNSKTVDLAGGGNGATIDVKADVFGGTVLDVVYSVTIDWNVVSSLQIKGSVPYIWDPATLKYVANSSTLTIPENKDKADVEINITNNSNADVWYNITYQSNDSVVGTVSSTFTPETDQDKSDALTDKLTRADATFVKNTGVYEDYGYNAVPFGETVTAGTTTGTATSAKVTGKVEMTKVSDTALQGDSALVGWFAVLISSTELSKQQIHQRNLNLSQTLPLGEVYILQGTL